MANETTVQTSSTQENHENDECRENIPPGVTTVTGTPKVQEGDIGYSSAQQSGENEPLSDPCTFSTPAPANVNKKSRLSGLQSALTPILKYLNVGNKCLSPETLASGNNPHLTVPSLSFGNTMANCRKTTAGSGQCTDTDFTRCQSGRSLGDTNAPVCWLADENLPDISLLDDTCDTMMQPTKNDSALHDSMPSTPVTAGSARTFTNPPPYANLDTTPQLRCPQNKTLDRLHSNVRNPKVESEATDGTSAVLKNTSETSLVMSQSTSTSKTGCSYDVQDAKLDRYSHQKSCVLGEAGAISLCLQNNTFNPKPSSVQNSTITGTETSSCDGHQTSWDKSCPSKVFNAKESYSQVDPAEVSKHNEITASEDCNAKIVDIPESINAPLRFLDDRYFPEITLLDVTRDSDYSPRGERSSLEIRQNISSVESLQNDMPSSALSGHTVAEPSTLDMIQSEDLSNTLDGDTTHTISSHGEHSKCVEENIPKASLEVTRDISMGSGLEDIQPSLELSGKNMVKTQTSVEDCLGIHPANVTHDINSSSDMSHVQCVASQLSVTQCNTSAKNVPSELHSEPVVAKSEELLSSHDAELTSKVPQPADSVNSTFTINKQSNLSESTNANTTAQMLCPQNKTLALPPSNVNSPKAESDTNDQPTSVLKNTTEASPVINQNCSSVKLSGAGEVQNVTFDRHSLQKPTGNTILGEAAATTFNLQSNTFDMKSPKQNGTITLSETGSSDSHPSVSDNPPPKGFNSTNSPKDKRSEVHTPEVSKHDGTAASTDSDAKIRNAPDNMFESHPALEVGSGAAQRETKDNSQPGRPMRDCLSDTLGHQSMDIEENKANTFNLDDTLDLRADSLITSTPMTNCKILNFPIEREEGKTIGAQKKLYRDGPSKPDGQVPSDVPSNIVCDRKTFLTQPAAKSLLPPLKAASQLLKYKPAALLPGRFEPMTSGLPLTRQRSQTEALRNTATSDMQVTTGISSSYDLRRTTTGSKQPTSCLRKPRLSGIPSSIQRAAPGLKLPSARSSTPASSSTDKLHGPAASNPAKKHPITRGEALPIAKKKKMDTPLTTEASTSSCDAANRAKNLKQPTATQKALLAKTQRVDGSVPAGAVETSTSANAVSRVRALKQPVTSHRALVPKLQSHGCAKCAMLEQQLEMKSEEIRRLTEELLKYSKPDEEY